MKVWIISGKDWKDWNSDYYIESLWDSEDAAQKELERLEQRYPSIYYFLASFDVQS